VSSDSPDQFVLHLNGKLYGPFPSRRVALDWAFGVIAKRGDSRATYEYHAQPLRSPFRLLADLAGEAS
jgi:hypothetical protein